MDLPIMNDNYLKDLGYYTDTLYRETDPYGAISLIDPNTSGQIGETYFANTKDLAKGQGGNKGLLLEFNSKGLQGQVNRNKPGWDFAYNNGSAEFIANHNPKKTYLDNIKSVTITDPKALKNTYGIRLLNMFKNNNWLKSVGDNGIVKFTKGVTPIVNKALMGINPYFEVRDTLEGMGHDWRYIFNTDKGRKKLLEDRAKKLMDGGYKLKIQPDGTYLFII